MSEKGWKSIPIGGLILEPGTAVQYKTGGWRVFRPLRDEYKCNDCFLCWIYCPDSSILVKDGTLVGIDWEHCKGCGICSQVCPIDAIEMVGEEDAKVKKG